MKYKKIIKFFNDNNGSFVRSGKGSHEIWQLNGKKITVPRSNSADISRVIIWKIEKRLGLPKGYLVNY